MRSRFRKKDKDHWPNKDAQRAFVDAIVDEVAREVGKDSAPTWESMAWAAFVMGGAAWVGGKQRSDRFPPEYRPAPAAPSGPDPDLVALGLPGLSVPSPEVIRTAYRAEMLRVHPDGGGSNAAAARVAAAYARLRVRGLVNN